MTCNQHTLYLVTSYFNTLKILCRCAQARLLGLATHSSQTSDHKMIYHHCLNNKFNVDQIFIRPHYSTTHTQLLITLYIVKHLYYWTQDVTNKHPNKIPPKSNLVIENWHQGSNPKYSSHQFATWNSQNDIISQEWNSAPKITNNYKV